MDTPRFLSLPVDDPGVGLISAVDVVLRQQARQPRAQRGAVHPALTGAALLHRRREDEVSWHQLQLVVILRHIRVHDLQCLHGGGRWGAAVRQRPWGMLILHLVVLGIIGIIATFISLDVRNIILDTKVDDVHVERKY